MESEVLRVKVYKLNDEGTWDDNGTGHVNIEYHSQGVGIVVVSEQDSTSLLKHNIGAETVYQRQGEDTIITWSDNEIGTDVALSFQETAGCNRVWRQIQDVQEGNLGFHQDDQLSPGSSDGLHSGGGVVSVFGRHGGSMVDEFDASPIRGSPYDDLGPLGHGPAGAAAAVHLPLPTLDNLVNIANALNEATMFQREALASQILAPGFIARLIAAFKTAEDLEAEESLIAVHNVIKAAILLNDTGLLEVFFSDEYATDIIGALEYDPAVPAAERAKHREFLAGAGALREVVPISDPILRSKIVQAHLMGYVKDIVLPRALDDSTFATLSSLQLFNQVEVLVALQADEKFFPDLFVSLQNAKPASEEWKDLVGFLQELVTLARHLQASQRNSLLGKLAELGLFPVLASVLSAGDTMSKLRAADILLADVAHDPATLRAYLQSDGSDLFCSLVDSVLDPSTAGLQEQALEILKVLLDPDTMDSSVEKDRFIDTFYEEYVGKLLKTVVAAGDGTAPAEAGTLILIMDLLCYCVTQHSYRIKYYILRNNVVEKVLRLLQRKEKSVAVAALRFLRTCLSMRDEFYNRYLVKNELLEPVLTAFLKNGRRYNLFNSAVLELLDFLRRENMKGLITAIVESPQWTKVESDCDYVETLKKLKMRHEANVEGKTGPLGCVPEPLGTAFNAVAGGASGAGRDAGVLQGRELEAQQNQKEQMEHAARAAAAAEARRRRGEREEDADEENYFSREDDDEEEEHEARIAVAEAEIGGGGSDLPRPIRPGQVILEDLSSPLQGLLPPGKLVDYEEDEDDTLPLGAISRVQRSVGEIVLKRGPPEQQIEETPPEKKARVEAVVQVEKKEKEKPPFPEKKEPEQQQ